MIGTVTIVGLGNVGGAVMQALGFRLETLGITVKLNGSSIGLVAVSHRDVDTWLSNYLKPEASSLKHVIVLSVPAHAIAELVLKMSTLDLTNTLVIHTNGSLQPDVLAPLQKCYALIAAAHPYQTFADADHTALDGIAWGVECAEDAWEMTSAFVDLVGGYAIHLGTLTPGQKRIYHASAVAASNFSYAAYSLARKLAEEVNIEAATFLSPIMERTLHNALNSIEKEEEFAITGPLARADEQAVVDQLHALPEELRRSYAALSLGLLEVIEVEEGAKQRLRSILHRFMK